MAGLNFLKFCFACIQTQAKKNYKCFSDDCTTLFDIQSMEMLVLGPFVQLTADFYGWKFQSSYLVIDGNPLPIVLCILFNNLLIHACTYKTISVFSKISQCGEPVLVPSLLFLLDNEYYALLFTTCSTFSRLL